MKKVLALVLATAMMATVAMAATVNFTRGQDDLGINPGDTLRIKADEFGVSYKDFDSEYFAITTKKITKGASLIKSVAINDDKGAIDIKFNQDYSLKRPDKKNIEIEKLEVKTKKKVNEGGVNEIAKNKTFVAAENLSLMLGYAKTPDIKLNDDDLTVGASSIRLGMINVFDAGTKSYALACVDFSDMAYAEGRVYDGDEVFYDYDEDADTAVLKAYPDAELSFVNIYTNGFPTAMALEVYAEKDEFVYAVKDGKVVSSGLKWNEDAYAWTGKIRSAASYVVSDVELKVAASEAPSADGSTTNPETGANDVVGVAAALAVVSLVAAGAVSLKK